MFIARVSFTLSSFVFVCFYACVYACVCVYVPRHVGVHMWVPECGGLRLTSAIFLDGILLYVLLQVSHTVRARRVSQSSCAVCLRDPTSHMMEDQGRKLPRWLSFYALVLTLTQLACEPFSQLRFYICVPRSWVLESLRLRHWRQHLEVPLSLTAMLSAVTQPLVTAAAKQGHSPMLLGV